MVTGKETHMNWNQKFITYFGENRENRSMVFVFFSNAYLQISQDISFLDYCIAFFFILYQFALIRYMGLPTLITIESGKKLEEVSFTLNHHQKQVMNCLLSSKLDHFQVTSFSYSSYSCHFLLVRIFNFHPKMLFSFWMRFFQLKVA